MPIPPISACIIARNEEANIVDCLRSVDWVDEVVVVDCGSTDRTTDLCRESGAKVEHRDWTGHIDQKNHAIDVAKNGWVLCIDADERVSPELQDEILHEMESAEGCWDGFVFPRRTHYLGRWISHSGWYPDLKLRLFKREKGRWGGVNPHDEVTVTGNTKQLRHDLWHFSYDSISDHLDTINSFTSIAAAEKLRMNVGLVLLHMLFNPAVKFVKTYFFKLGILDGLPGFVIAVNAAFYVFLKYAKLWELRKASSVDGDGQSAGT